MRSPAPFVLAVTVVALAGCGGATKASLPGCVHHGPAVAGALPGGFPLPAGSVIDRTGSELGRTLATGYVPGMLADVRDYYRRALPAGGYRLGEGDAEEHEAETDFSGRGIDGHLKLHDVAGCVSALTIAVAYRASA